MAVEADLVAYLDTQLSETAGTDLFEGPMAELPDNQIVVTHYASEESDDYTMGASLSAPGSEIVMVQVMARNTVKATALARAQAAHAKLDNLQNQTLSGRSYFTIEAQGEPFSLGQDQQHRWRYVANFRVRKARG